MALHQMAQHEKAPIKIKIQNKQKLSNFSSTATADATITALPLSKFVAKNINSFEKGTLHLEFIQNLSSVWWIQQ